MHCGLLDLVSDTFCLRDEIGSHREFGAHSDTNLDCYLRPSSNTRLDSTSTSRLLYAKDGLRKIITRIGNVSLQLDGRIRHHRIMRRRFALSWRRDRARLEMRPKNEAEITIHRDIGWGRRVKAHAFNVSHPNALKGCSSTESQATTTPTTYSIARDLILSNSPSCSRIFSHGSQNLCKTRRGRRVVSILPDLLKDLVQ